MKPALVSLLLAALTISSSCAQEQPVKESDALLSLLKQPASFWNNFSNQFQLTHAVERCGELKLVEAIPYLVEHIDFVYFRIDVNRGPRPMGDRSSDPEPPLTRGSAVHSLIQIGKPTLNPVLEASRHEDKDFRVFCMSLVLRKVEGTEKAKARIDAAIAETSDPSVKMCLTKLRSKLDVNLPPEN